jgi:ubiquinone/menaquinone biosynthesis C-methylase UbiE
MAPTIDPQDPLLALLPSDTERLRYEHLVQRLSAWRTLFTGRRVLDFGASWGTSAVALIRVGAAEVIGVEPDLARVKFGSDLLARVGVADRVSLLHTPDTDTLRFADRVFPFVLTNGVLEHIPQPRDPYIREVWRVIAPGGHLMVTETPNVYWPKEFHTTGLWFNHWLPVQMAHRRAVRNGRFSPARQDWVSSGWRGMSFYELVRPIRDYRLIHENTRCRHRVFSSLGLPASIIDPDPIWILRKER